MAHSTRYYYDAESSTARRAFSVLEASLVQAQAERDEWQEAAMLNAQSLAKAVEGLRRLERGKIPATGGGDWGEDMQAYARSLLAEIEGENDG